MLRVAIGHSEDVQTKEAVHEVLDQILASLGEIEPQAGILFCSLDFDHTLILSLIKAIFPSIELVGCTTDGEMSSVHGFSEDSLVLIVFASNTVEIQAGVGRGASKRGMDAGREAALTAQRGLQRFQSEIRFAVILSDPHNAGVSEIDKGLEEVLGENFPFVGAAAAAHSKLKTTYQFYNDKVLTDCVVLLLFAGPIQFSCGIQGGHSPMGGKEVVTSVDKNILYRIGNRPALDYFNCYIGDKYHLFMNYCLAVFEEGREGFYVRSAPFCDPESGTVTLNGVIKEGSLVQIGTADKSTCIESCTNSVQQALANYPGSKPSAALLFSCAGRKMMMGTQVIKETQIVKKLLGDIPFCGFYSYGEIGPLVKGGKSLFHGTTFITLLLGSAEEICLEG